GLKNLTAADINARLVADNLNDVGFISTKDTIFNKVFHNAKFGVIENYKGMPVDCPQRDERQPWLGDHTVGCLGESFLFDNSNLYTKWVRDICESQREDGCIPDVAPAYWNYYSDNMTWPAALPFSLEMLYEQYGDIAPLQKHYPNVKKWMEHMKEQYGKDGLITKDKYGDWCVPPEKQELIHSQDPARITDGTLISTAYYYRLCLWMQKYAKMFGYEHDAADYARQAAETKAAFNKKFLTVAPLVPPLRGDAPTNKGNIKSPSPKGEGWGGAGHWLYPDSTFYGNNTQTANLLPYYFGMIDDEYVKREVEKNIVENIIVRNNGMISTGVIGCSWLMRSLSKMGRGDVAWLLATNKKYPSWGYMAEKGATTTWELWNGDTANPAMNSGNHIMLLGDLVTWMFQNVGGIRADAAKPGFKHIILKPDYDVDEI
ncbi:MAG: alpha-rhamnosidase, partial [Prevotella sp.]|nr:alpha-rhamnosidase [Prevotella sp.]